MSPLRRCLPLALGLLAVAPAATASAAAPVAPQPLVDAAPRQTSFVEGHLTGTPRTGATARAAAAGGTPRSAAYAAPDGQTVAVTFSPSYTPDASVAQSYVDFLGSLPHGSELSQLEMYIAPPAEVTQECGGVDGTLACYSSDSHTMVVPGEQVDDGTGVTTSYVIAHEYGHHIATFRSNAPWNAVELGPKRWASFEQVCARTIAGLLAPGDEDTRYLDNPGEAWADTYAHLTYPDTDFQFTKLLAPSAGGNAAALLDVRDPWTKDVTRRFSGTLGPASSRRFSFTVTLDGSLSLTLKGPGRANYDLRLTSGSQVVATTKAAGSRDRISLREGCRDRAAETLTATVVRRSGSGRFTLTAAYPG